MTRILEKRPSPMDMVLGAVLIGITILAGVRGGASGSGFESPDAAWKWVLLVIPSFLAIFRRTHPLQILAPATAAQIAIWGLGMPDTAAAVAIIAYSVAAEGGEKGKRYAIVATIVLTMMTGLGVAFAPDVTIVMVPQVALVGAGAVFLGLNAAREKGSAAEFARELAVSEARAEAAKESELQHERQSIARDLHDVIGHSLATIAVQAEAADRVSETNPQAAVDAVAVIAAAARSSLAEVRQVLGGLREGEATKFAPVPDLAAVGDMVEELRSTGLNVELTDRTSPGEVGPTVATGAYRIVQESLTNVVKHAGPDTRATVELSTSPGGLSIVIVDDGRGANGHLAESSGLGVVGMTERAQFLGGSLTAGSRPGGGFEVRARLPLSEARP